MLSAVPSVLRVTSQTWAPARGWPAGFKSRTAYDLPQASDTGSRARTTRGEPANRARVVFDVAASREAPLATGLDSGGALGLGGTAALRLDRPLPSRDVAAFGRALVSLGEVLVALDEVPVSRDVVPVPIGGGLVSRGAAITLSASRNAPRFVLARAATWPPEVGRHAGNIRPIRRCPARDSTNVASVTPIKTPSSFVRIGSAWRTSTKCWIVRRPLRNGSPSFGNSLPDRRRWKLRMLSSRSRSSSSVGQRGSIDISGRTSATWVLPSFGSTDAGTMANPLVASARSTRGWRRRSSTPDSIRDPPRRLSMMSWRGSCGRSDSPRAAMNSLHRSQSLATTHRRVG